jgi:hypothetical protein
MLGRAFEVEPPGVYLLYIVEASCQVLLVVDQLDLTGVDFTINPDGASDGGFDQLYIAFNSK